VMAPASLTPSAPAPITCPANISPLTVVGGQAAVHEFYGTVCQAGGTDMRLALRNGRAISIDVSHAFDRHRQVLLTPGRPLHVSVSIDKDGVARAQKISPSHMISPLTPADR
jgi:hypothetical protein